ncbi:uncharacterized protein LOC121656126 [Melanotaenia boesemani]|uniref:uncharacterized protein LOC121656126 n=1 Tax=Melanotaenia boesemani TaxID=1250792 RepID=UPI001C052095|nr:uncharacterized protein LOC121656126 [Melanotaenia boesemani]
MGISSVRDLILDYYREFRQRVSTGSITSEWHRLEVGIITGCTISVILFALAMNMLVKSVKPECRGPKSRSGIQQPPILAFMDDLTVITESVPVGRWILNGLEKLVSWASMSFNPSKSRSLVLKRGKVVDKFRFLISETPIPTILEKPVNSLGKWPLLLYEFPISTIDLEKKVSRYLRRWLDLPQSLSNIALYGNTCKLSLPLKSIEEEFKVLRMREMLQFRESKDPKVSGAGVAVKTGRKWRAEVAVEQAESHLRHGVLVGTVARGRARLGAIPFPRYDRVLEKERRQLVQDEVRAAVEEERSSRAVGMRQQGAWTRWEKASRATPHQVPCPGCL